MRGHDDPGGRWWRDRSCDRRVFLERKVRSRLHGHALADASQPRQGLTHSAAGHAANGRSHRRGSRSRRPAPSLRARGRIVHDKRQAALRASTGTGLSGAISARSPLHLRPPGRSVPLERSRAVAQLRLPSLCRIEYRCEPGALTPRQSAPSASDLVFDSHRRRGRGSPVNPPKPAHGCRRQGDAEDRGIYNRRQHEGCV